MPSTVIASFTYNPETSILKIVFVSGLIYEYINVPEEIYIQLRASTVKGTYFNRYVKTRYNFKKVQ
jgi:hypothetical protein